MNKGRKTGNDKTTFVADTTSLIESKGYTFDDILYIRDWNTKFFGDWGSLKEEVGNWHNLGGDIDGVFENLYIIFKDGSRMFRLCGPGSGEWIWDEKGRDPGRNDFAINAWNEFFRGPGANMLTPAVGGSSRREHLLHIIDTWLREKYVYMIDAFRKTQADDPQGSWSRSGLGPGYVEFLEDRANGLNRYSDHLLMDVSSVLKHMDRIVTNDTVMYSNMPWIRVHTGLLTERVETSQGEIRITSDSATALSDDELERSENLRRKKGD